MPTGVALRDARQRLFDAAERVLLHAGPVGLTSRAVTAEADVAKGVLHKHFRDFDGFLTELVLDRVAKVEADAARLRDRAGSATPADNLAEAVTTLFSPLGVAIVALVISRDALRSALREAGAGRLPLLGQGTAMIADYLAVERDLGRIERSADVDELAPTLVGAAHLLFTERQPARPTRASVRKLVDGILAGVAPRCATPSTSGRT